MRKWLVVMVGAVVVTLVVGDLVVASRIREGVADRVACMLDTSPSQVEVDVSGWPAATALVTERIGHVHLEAGRATLGSEITGTVTLDLEGVERGETGLSLEQGSASVTVPWSTIEDRLAERGRGQISLSGGPDGAVVAELRSGLGGVSLVADPEVRGSTITLRPTALRVGERELTGQLVDGIAERTGLASRTLEAPDIPGLTLSDATGTSDGLRLDLELDGGDLGRTLGGGRGCAADPESS